MEHRQSLDPAQATDLHNARLHALVKLIVLSCRLLDDLHELRAFLLQRAAEQDATTPASLAAAMPEDLQLWETSGTASAVLASIEEALASLSGPRATQLLMLQVHSVGLPAQAC